MQSFFPFDFLLQYTIVKDNKEEEKEEEKEKKKKELQSIEMENLIHFGFRFPANSRLCWNQIVAF